MDGVKPGQMLYENKDQSKVEVKGHCFQSFAEETVQDENDEQ